jgi:RHS repeat-associated protein
LGSTNALVDAAGGVTAQTGYDAFGNQTAALPTRYGYTGRERDDFTGLMHYRARHYSPELGRFISEDPIGLAGGDINIYAYVGNSPTNYKDPSGLERYGGTFYKEAAEGWNEFHKRRIERDYHDGFKPENFRCGPHRSSILSLIIPQHPLGYNFKDTACYNHDVCYGICGKSQGQCDDEFLTDMEKECNSKGNWFERQACLLATKPYYYIVGGLGGGAYKDSQKYNKCDKCEK